MQFSFNESIHKYTLDGNFLPSVTQIVNYDLDKSFFKDFHRDRGVAVHKACDLFIRGKLNESSLHVEVKPYFEQFKKLIKIFGSDIVFDLEKSDKPDYSSEYMYAGTPDIICTIYGKKTLIDIKTGSHKNVDMQLAAYANLNGLKGIKFENFFCLSLKPDCYKLRQFRDIDLSFVKFLKKFDKFKNQ